MTRGVRWLVLLLGLALVVVVHATGPGDRGEGTSAPTRPPALAPDLTGRGWVLDDEGRPPVGVDGMRLTDAVEVDYRQQEGTVRLGAGWRTGGARYAVLWCDLPALDDPALRPPTLTLTFDEGTVQVPCAGKEGTPPLTRLHPLPPAGPEDRPAPEHAWSGDLPRRGSATLAVYLELYGAPLRSGPLLDVPDAPDGSAGLDSSAPTVRHGAGTVQVAMVGVEHDSRLELWAGEPGLLTLAVDGIVVTDDGDLDDDDSDWAQQDPDLRAGAWFAARPGARRTLDLPAELVPVAGRSRTVVLSVEGARALPRSWSVQVVPGSPEQPQGAALATPVPDGLPDVPGLVPAGAWLVPRDGHRHELPVAPSPDDDPWTWGWVVLGTDGPPTTPATLTRGEQLRRVPHLQDTARLAETLLRQVRVDRAATGDGPTQLSASVPPAPGQPPLQIVAWRPSAP
ncbi:hypothetical protein ACI3ET_03515 [Ornithinimicrobium sp. LYQ121]|uniref:hypothetical protein n=1 Tax=Ornithinimicrobium sp. LYQ121 TaxID=3378801 RepID=UPI003851B764